jgi:cold shock CspA family protein
MEGVIQNVFLERGFGFIRAASGIKYFFKQTSLRNTTMDKIYEGQEVTFEDSQAKGLETAEDIYVHNLFF